MPLAVAFGTGLDLLGGLCVAVGWPWLVGSSVPSATQAQQSLSSPALSPFTPCPLPPFTHPYERRALTLLQTTTTTCVCHRCPKAPALPFSSFTPSNTPPGITTLQHNARGAGKESEADNKSAPNPRSASCCHHPVLIPWQARLPTLLVPAVLQVQGPTCMSALWSHGLVAGWLCLFSRLRLLGLLGLDQLRLSYSDKLESK